MGKARKKKKRKRGKINALHTFINAWSYQYVTKVLNDHPAHKDHLLWPMIVNEAFALELFLKCLHETRRRIVDGHTPRELFGLLSKSDKKRIELRYNAIVVGHPLAHQAAKEAVPLDIDAVLARSEKLFTAGRYWHEGLIVSRDSSGFATNAGVGSLSDAIRDLLYVLRPDWKDKIAQFKWKFSGNTRLTT